MGGAAQIYHHTERPGEPSALYLPILCYLLNLIDSAHPLFYHLLSLERRCVWIVTKPMPGQEVKRMDGHHPYRRIVMLEGLDQMLDRMAVTLPACTMYRIE